MIPISRFKATITIIICVIGLIYTIPTFLNKKQLESFPMWWPDSKITLGLDLVGGSQILLEADFKQALGDRYESSIDNLRRQLRMEKVGYRGIKAYNDHIIVTMRSADRYSKTRSVIQKSSNGKMEVERLDEQRVKVYYKPEEIDRIKDSIIDQSITKIASRVNQLGTSEPNIMRQGQNRIMVQLPGVKDPSGLQKIIGKTAKLSFHLVVEKDAPKNIIGGTMSLPVVEKGYESESSFNLRVYKKPFLTGNSLIESYDDIDRSPGGFSRPVVFMGFDGTGARKFSHITKNNVGRRFAVVLDGKIITHPVIRGHIPAGTGIIQGNFTPKEAKDLSILMRSGALPTQLNTIEELTVGPDLGSDSISAGEKATVLAIILVSIFMLLAYTSLGAIADFALVFNIILLIAAMVITGSTLTLQGIAGIALTIGMAVDANVLIFERIKEELRRGVEPSSAIKDGFDKAIATIVDSNLTTLIGAVVLFSFGSGFVRGFAVTLSMGILISMFTAVTLTKILVAAWFNRVNLQKVTGINIIPSGTKFDFISIKKITYAISVLFIVLSIGSCVMKGFNFGIDFKGGYLFDVKLAQGQDITKIRPKLNAANLGDVKLQNYGDSSRNVMIRIEGNEELDTTGVKTEVSKILGEGTVYRKIESIGPKVSAELIEKSAYGLLIAIIAMLIYIWLRFEWHFSAGAVLAQIHDVIAVIGFYSIFALEFNEQAIIAILTTLGYSINDTVVIYDRIRENLRVLKRESISEVINKSINETLSRTTLTSATTLLALVALYIFGGAIIEVFVLPIIIGIIVGTYSSIFVAAPLLVNLNLDRDAFEKSKDEIMDDPTVVREDMEAREQ